MNFIIINKSKNQKIVFFNKNFKIANMIIPQFSDAKDAKVFKSKDDAQKIINQMSNNIAQDCFII